MAVGIQNQIALGNIYFIDSSGYYGENTLNGETIVEGFLSSSIEPFEASYSSSSYGVSIFSALAAMEPSASFQSAIGSLGSFKRLTIDLLPIGEVGSIFGEVFLHGNTYTIGVLGLGNLADLSSINYIRADGTMGTGISIKQALAHELSHALLDARDTTGSGSTLDFHGDAVRFENQVLAELGGGWDYRPGYFALLGDVNLTIPTSPTGQSQTSWTDGNVFDTVVRDVSSTPSAAGPGKNIDLSGRPVIEDFLIIAHVDSSGQSILSGGGNDYIYAMAGNDTVNGMSGNDYIDGGAGNDMLSGSGGNDTIWGNIGADTIFGGAGDDFIFFDAQDLNFNGNTGFDTARYQQIGDHRALVIDMGAREIEVLITGNKADRVIATGEGPLLVATGGGSDHITFQNGCGAPTIVIGGSGADTCNVQVDADSNDPVGILKIKVWGLTNDNLPHLTLDMLGMPANFDWSQIDLVMANCDAQDRVTINGRQLRLETVSTEMNYTWTDGNTGDTHVEDMGNLTETVFRQVIQGEGATVIWERRLGHIPSDFLNGSADVFASQSQSRPIN